MITGAINVVVDSAACVELALVKKVVQGGDISLNNLFKTIGFRAEPNNAGVMKMSGMI